MTDFVDLEPAASAVAGLLAGIDETMLAAPTPCGIPVSTLLSHLSTLSEAFRAGAEKAPDVGPRPPAPPPPLDPSWGSALPARLDALVTAWRDPAAWEGTATVGGAEMPAPIIAAVALDELVLHGWDLARATGQPFSVDPASIQACRSFVDSISRPEGVPGLFGPPVPVAADAGALDQLVGQSGRDPSWSPVAGEAACAGGAADAR